MVNSVKAAEDARLQDFVAMERCAGHLCSGLQDCLTGDYSELERPQMFAEMLCLLVRGFDRVERSMRAATMAVAYSEFRQRNSQ